MNTHTYRRIVVIVALTALALLPIMAAAADKYADFDILWLGNGSTPAQPLYGLEKTAVVGNSSFISLTIRINNTGTVPIGGLCIVYPYDAIDVNIVKSDPAGTGRGSGLYNDTHYMACQKFEGMPLETGTIVYLEASINLKNDSLTNKLIPILIGIGDAETLKDSTYTAIKTAYLYFDSEGPQVSLLEPRPSEKFKVPEGFDELVFVKPSSDGNAVLLLNVTDIPVPLGEPTTVTGNIKPKVNGTAATAEAAFMDWIIENYTAKIAIALTGLDTNSVKLYNVTVTVYDNAKNNRTIKIAVVSDPNPPTLEITSPNPSEWNTTYVKVDQDNESFTLEITDDSFKWLENKSGILDYLNVKVYRDGTEIPLLEEPTVNSLNAAGKAAVTFKLNTTLPGVYKVIVTAWDPASRLNAETLYIESVVDRTTPTILEVVPASGEIVDNIYYVQATDGDGDDLELKISVSDDTLWGIFGKKGTIEVYINNKINATMAAENYPKGDTVYTVTTVNFKEEEAYNVSVKVTDPAGRESEWYNITVKVDRTAPSIDVKLPAAGENYESTLPVYVKVSDASPVHISIVLWSSDMTTSWMLTSAFDKDGEYVYAGYINISSLPEGKYYLQVSASDAAGNENSAPVQFYIDRSPPELDLQCGGGCVNGYIKPESASLRLNVYDVSRQALVQIYVNGVIAKNNTVDTPASIDLTGKIGEFDWQHGDKINITVIARDKFGHTTVKSWQFTVDLEPPVCSVDYEHAISLPGGYIVKLECSDPTGVKIESAYPAETWYAKLEKARGSEWNVVNAQEFKWDDPAALAQYVDVISDAINAREYFVVYHKGYLIIAAREDGNVTIDVSDGVDNSGSVRIEFDVVEGDSVVYPLPLYRGWNLVSLPLFTKINTSVLGDYLVGISRSNIEIYYYSNGEWRFYVRGIQSTLPWLEDGAAYWIKVDDNAILVVPGKLQPPADGSQPPAYQLEKGWNMVGYIAEGRVKFMKLLNANDPGAFIRDEQVINSIAHYIYAWDPVAQKWIVFDKFQRRWVVSSGLTDNMGALSGYGGNVVWPGIGLFIYAYEGTALQPGAR